MGIPSYYKKLARTVNGFYCEPPAAVDYFLMDYNCLIYQVLRSMPTFTESDPHGYESLLVERTLEYTSILIDMVRPKHTYIALDGVVPLAKMKQQRMRRFRAIELAAEERRLGLRSGPSWDTNAITPGTAFMERLAIMLRIRFPEATIISDTSEPGEGEHKLMRFMRTKGQATHVIYGLDGDLFVLALLNQQLYVPDAPIYFFREEANRESGGTDYIWLALDRLKVALLGESEGVSDAKTWLTEYALAMSLLGNDFVPQSLAFRIKEGGHERLIKYLKQLHRAGQRLLADGCRTDAGLDWDGWQQIFRWLANEEEMRIGQAIEKKRISRRTQVGQSATDALRAKISDRPLEWFAEADGQLWNEGSLVPNWRDRYAEIGLGSPAVSVSPWYHKVAAARYLESIDWVYEYYIGDPTKVDWDWMYEFNSAPLFEHVVTQPHVPLKGPQGPPPTPHEQLSLVLPRESYRLIPKCKERNFLHRAPEYFPQKWSYFHFGKRFFWECEAHIPLPTIRFLRHIIVGH